MKTISFDFMNFYLIRYIIEAVPHRKLENVCPVFVVIVIITIIMITVACTKSAPIVGIVIVLSVMYVLVY
jgi:hypothetical protein